jgi:hypothetical protein
VTRIVVVYRFLAFGLSTFAVASRIILSREPNVVETLQSHCTCMFKPIRVLADFTCDGYEK